MGYTNINFRQPPEIFQFQFHDKQYDWIEGDNGIPKTLECSMLVFKAIKNEYALISNGYRLVKQEEVLNIPSEYFDFEKKELEDNHVVYKAEFTQIEKFVADYYENLIAGIPPSVTYKT